uniref:Uncharacterized protein n=1 Tax=Rhizophora mucronata TaxID=61149 RepID=A0A2P2QIP0_RHIMU
MQVPLNNCYKKSTK